MAAGCAGGARRPRAAVHAQAPRRRAVRRRASRRERGSTAPRRGGLPGRSAPRGSSSLSPRPGRAELPEGDALHRAARRLQPLVGEHVEVETPNPRAQVGRIAERLDGRRLLSVEAVGKNLLLTFEGDIVLRSHLRMTGRWSVVPRGATRRGRPWLILRGSTLEAVQ